MDDAIVIACTFCGAIVGRDTRHVWDPKRIAEHHDEQLQAMLRPTAVQARQQLLGARMYEASERGDRETWRMLSQESLTLLALTNPAQVGFTARDRARFGSWLRAALVMGELGTFDPDVKSAQNGFGSAAGALLRADDPVAEARRVLESARAMYRAYANHPDLPPDALPDGIEAHARTCARQAVASYEPMLGPGVAKRIYAEVFGDAVADAAAGAHCRSCGAALASGEDLVACRHCGAVVAMTAEDPWLRASLASWELARADLVKRERLDGTEPVLAALHVLLLPYYQRPRDAHVSPDDAFAFLARVIPWIPRADVERGIALLRTANEASRRDDLLAALLARTPGWTCEPSLRPTTVRRPPLAPPTLEEQQAWIVGSLATFSYSRDACERDPQKLVETLYGIATAPFHFSEVSDAPPVTVDAALGFFAQAAPNYDRAAMHAFCMRMAPCHADRPSLRDFLVALAQRVTA